MYLYIQRYKYHPMHAELHVTVTCSLSSLPGSKESSALSSSARAGISVGIIVLILLALLALLVVAALCYGYRRPSSKLGMFMIEVYMFVVGYYDCGFLVLPQC